MTKQPKHVIRFYGNIQYAIECIGLKQITFLHIDKLNDPFDSPFSFETAFNADYQTLIKYIQQNHAKDIYKFKERLPKQNWDGFIQDMEFYSNKLRDSSFIFSTSEISEENHPKDNLYMWSHYANGHRGVAVEFDTTLLSKAVLERQKMLGEVEVGINEIISKINYLNEIPKITCENIVNFVINDTPISDENAWMETELADILRKRASSKSIGWELEKEWRLMWHNDETRLKFQRVDMIDETIIAIYLGLRYPLIDDHIRDDLIFETKRNFPRAKIFRAIKGKGKSLLDFKLVAPANGTT